MPLSAAEFKALKNETFLLATQIGLSGAARTLNLNYDRVRKWASRDKWQFSIIRPNAGKAYAKVQSRDVTQLAREVLNEHLKKCEDMSRIAMARTGLRAFEHCDTLSDGQLHERDRAIALQNHAKNLQLAHFWFPQTNAVNVGVQVNTRQPTEAERAEMTAIDRKLDAITARLKHADRLALPDK